MYNRRSIINRNELILAATSELHKRTLLYSNYNRIARLKQITFLVGKVCRKSE